MELLDRYLQAVKKLLPWQRQDDIIAELQVNLESQLEEREAGLGRPLTPAEAEEWIRQLGSPAQMASHYQPQQYLIGPAIFPLYLYVLRLASMWAIAIYILVSTITLISNSSPAGAALAEAALRLPSFLIQVVGWVTLVFAALEFFAARCPDKFPPIPGFHAKWSPAGLPPLAPPLVPGRKRRTYAQAVTEVIFGFLVLAWLLAVPEHPYLMFGPGAAFLHASPFRLAPVWMTFYWWVVGLSAIQQAWRCIDLVRGAWQQPDRAQQVIVRAFGLIPLVLMLNVHGRMYMFLRNPDLDQPHYGPTLDVINNGIHTAAEVMCAIIALQLAWDIVQLVFNAWRKRAQSR